MSCLLFSDAEPKYLVVVQPVAPNEVKKQCSGNTLTVLLEEIALR